MTEDIDRDKGEVARHERPDGANHRIMIDLSDHDFPGSWEEIWVEDLGNEGHVVRSIPFFVYGIAPGDQIKLDEDGNLVELAHGGSHVLRIVRRDDCPDEVFVDFSRVVGDAGLAMEWHNDGFMAIQIPKPEVPRAFSDQLHALEDREYIASEISTNQ